MADEGSRLLEALSKVYRRRATKRQGDAQWLRIRVSDVHTNKTSARVNLPVGIVDVGLRMGGQKLSPIWLEWKLRSSRTYYGKGSQGRSSILWMKMMVSG